MIDIQENTHTHTHTRARHYKDPQPASAFRARSQTSNHFISGCGQWTTCRLPVVLPFTCAVPHTAPVYHSTDIHTVITTGPWKGEILRICIEIMCTVCTQGVQERVHISCLYIKFEMCIFIFLWRLADSENLFSWVVCSRVDEKISHWEIQKCDCLY